MACHDGICLVCSFFGRLVAYFGVLALLVIASVLILKCIGNWRERSFYEINRVETVPLMHQHYAGKMAESSNYGTYQQDIESATRSNNSNGSCTSRSKDCAKELYNTKICIICYDELRNCFFVPCGHRATCHVCAQRIFKEESRNCPICRRFISKVRKVFDS